MATLDVSLTGYFSVIFTFLFVFVLVYAILEYLKPFGKDANKGWHSMLALCISVLVVIYKPAVGLISFLAPWFLIIAVVTFFILFILGMFGLKEQNFLTAVKTDSTIYTFVIVFAIVIVVIGLGSVYGQAFLQKASPTQDSVMVDNSTYAEPITVTGEQGNNYQQNVYNTIFHPKILGFIFLMLVGVFTIVFLTKSQS